MSNHRIRFLAILIVMCLTHASFAATLRVKLGAGGLGDGSTWTDAYPTLQAAILAATDGDQIWVAVGTHRPAAPGNRSATFLMEKGVQILGGFAGTETLESDRNWSVNVTILSGDLNHNDDPDFGDEGENSYHVVSAIGDDPEIDSTAVLDGFTIAGDNASDLTGDLDCDCEDCHMMSAASGAGLAIYKASPTIRNCIFTSNHALFGGAIRMICSESQPIISKCTFDANWARETEEDVEGQANNYGNGGAIYATFGSSPYIANCTFVNNTAGHIGGGFAHSVHSRFSR